MSYSDVLQDNEHAFIYINNGSIVKETDSSCMEFNFSEVMNGKGYVLYKNSSKLKVFRKDNGDGLCIKFLPD